MVSLDELLAKAKEKAAKATEALPKSPKLTFEAPGTFKALTVKSTRVMKSTNPKYGSGDYNFTIVTDTAGNDFILPSSIGKTVAAEGKLVAGTRLLVTYHGKQIRQNKTGMDFVMQVYGTVVLSEEEYQVVLKGL